MRRRALFIFHICFDFFFHHLSRAAPRCLFLLFTIQYWLHYTIFNLLYHIEFIIPYWYCASTASTRARPRCNSYTDTDTDTDTETERHTHTYLEGEWYFLLLECVYLLECDLIHIHTPHTHTHIKSGRHVHCWGNSFKRDLIPFQKRPNTVSKETCSVSTFEATVYFIIIIIIYYIIIIILLIYIYIHTRTHTYTSICTYKNIYIYTHRHTDTHRHITRVKRDLIRFQKRPNTVSKET